MIDILLQLLTCYSKVSNGKAAFMFPCCYQCCYWLLSIRLLVGLLSSVQLLSSVIVLIIQ